MVETSPPTNTFRMMRLIGGKLRALYDEEAQSCASQINDLLETLGSAKTGALATLDDDRAGSNEQAEDKRSLAG
jgi:hypothetical protein